MLPHRSVDDGPITRRARELAIAAGHEWCTRTYLDDVEDERADELFREYLEQARAEAGRVA